jgi:hypothetical protein
MGPWVDYHTDMAGTDQLEAKLRCGMYIADLSPQL